MRKNALDDVASFVGAVLLVRLSSRERASGNAGECRRGGLLTQTAVLTVGSRRFSFRG